MTHIEFRHCGRRAKVSNRAVVDNSADFPTSIASGCDPLFDPAGAVEEVGQEDVSLYGVQDALGVAGGECDAEGLQRLVEERARLRLAAVRA